MQKLIILILLISIEIFGQAEKENKPGRASSPADGRIFGTVIDSLSSRPIEYSNVSVFRIKDTSLVTGGISNTEGNFELTRLLPGAYFVKVSFIGYHDYKIDSLFIRPGKTDLDLGRIFLSSGAVNLDEIVVKSEKEMVNYTLDKKVINVEQNIASSGGTALDVLQNVPSLTVDVDGAVYLRGSSTITFLIDGKPSTLGGTNTDVLTQIPASSIESIELVTNPSAKYDAEGTAGIINIILKKKQDAGYNGNLSLNAGTKDKYNISASGNLREGDFNFYGNYDARLNKSLSTGTTARNNFTGVSSLIRQDFNSLFDFNMHNFGIGTDYFPDNRNTISLSLKYRLMKFGGGSDLGNRTFDQAGTLLSFTDRSSDSERDVDAVSSTLSYKYVFEKRKQELTADLIYNDFGSGRTEDISQNYFTSPSIASSELFQKTNSDNSSRMLTIQSDYFTSPDDKSKIETGFRVSMREQTSANSYYDFMPASNSWAFNNALWNQFDYKENINAVYGTYTGEFSGIGYSAGLRAEQLNVKASFINTGTETRNSDIGFFPSAYLSYKFSPVDEILLNYSRRVDRPSGRELNPFVDISDSLNIRAGNPNLQPQYINSLEFGYSTMSGKTSYSATLFYKETNDLIAVTTKLLSSGATFTTYENIAYLQSYGLELLNTLPINDWWRLNSNLSFFRTNITGNGSNFNDVSADSWTLKINSGMTIWEDIQLQIIGNYNSPSYSASMGWGRTMVSGQTKIDGFYFVDLALRKDFMQRKLSVTLRFTDLFNSRSFNSQTDGTDFSSLSRRVSDSQIAYLGISYNFSSGKIESERKRRPDESQDMDMF
ncbi:MAG: TonB-dependent receptor [Ignavibacteriales bacterium]|nr:TonB-dependent receptor [Ignavibacteriales bacterium]MCF8305755.1 TonB-dependent receptor [Ignavibacteriales bacterium]MCF8315477.1 TonB-dependent receptor [Ignavibacteriales bacterium]MCF8436995.1 TonB-dependent receptor [Ignavibacteriales bacterium]